MKLQKAKEKAMKLINQAVALSKAALQFAVEYTVMLVVLAGLSVAILKLPEAHNKYLRWSVGSKVYTIRDSYESGGGTGFAIKAPSGQSYILTNDHVCGVSKDGLTVLVTGDQGSMRRRIIAHDENSDLCLVEGLPGVEGLKTAMLGPSKGDTLNIVGHPLLMPKHLESGELISSMDVSIPLGPISVINPRNGQEELIDPAEGGIAPEQCQMNKHSQEMVDFDMLFFILKVKFCVMNVNQAYSTGMTIHPGNSGSPVVNFWGNVIGVAFASNTRTNWGLVVSLDDIEMFLANY